jgi:hypothetical protein
LLVQLAIAVVVPAFHLWNHRPDHTHGPDGVTHTHQAPERPGVPTAPTHDGHGTAQHFGLALTATDTVVVALVVTPAVTPVGVSPAGRLCGCPTFGISSPRGPPAAAI